MKQYTTPGQTAKLIGLGFEKPKSISGYDQRGPYEHDAETNTKMVVYDDTQYPIYAYSIGELIEMLPAVIRKFGGCHLNIYREESAWYVYYNPIIAEVTAPIYSTNYTELIDALFEMLVLLKEEGVI